MPGYPLTRRIKMWHIISYHLPVVLTDSSNVPGVKIMSYDARSALAWAHYEEIVGMGGFEPITTEWLEECAPNLLEIIPEAAWAETLVDGVGYCVPAGEADLRSDVHVVRGDLLEAAGMTDITNYCKDMKALYEAGW